VPADQHFNTDPSMAFYDTTNSCDGSRTSYVQDKLKSPPDSACCADLSCAEVTSVNNNNNNDNAGEAIRPEVPLENGSPQYNTQLPDLFAGQFTCKREDTKHLKNIAQPSCRRTSGGQFKVSLSRKESEQNTGQRCLCFVKPMSSSTFCQTTSSTTAAQKHRTISNNLNCEPFDSCKYSGHSNRVGAVAGISISNHIPSVTDCVEINPNHPLAESKYVLGSVRKSTDPLRIPPKPEPSTTFQGAGLQLTNKYSCLMRRVESKARQVAIASAVPAVKKPMSSYCGLQNHHNETIVIPNVHCFPYNKTGASSHSLVPQRSSGQVTSTSIASAAIEALETAIDRASKLPPSSSSASTTACCKPIASRATSRRHKVFDSQQQQQQQHQQPLVVHQMAATPTSSRPWRTAVLLGRRTFPKRHQETNGEYTRMPRLHVTRLVGFLLVGLVCGALMLVYMRYQLSYEFTVSAMMSSLTGNTNYVLLFLLCDTFWFIGTLSIL